MILLCGIRSEGPMAMVARELDRLGTPVCWFDQRKSLEMRLELEVDGRGVHGRLEGPGGGVALDDVRAVYVRTMDDRLLPEVETLSMDAPERLHVRSCHDRLLAWLEATPARVVNRGSTQASNASKPYQSQLIVEAGFSVPQTLISNDPAAVLEFRAGHGRIVYKSMSGVRSIVKVMTDLDAERLERIRWCPVQFQEYVEGVDVRVHTVGDEVFAARVTSWAVDYRYSGRSGAPDPLIEATALEASLADRCRRLAARMGLELAGIDLRIRPNGEVVCFEVNPSPAFSYYEERTGLPIAAAVARHLATA